MNSENTKIQVKDDPELLELMMKDTYSSSKLYKPTNFWANFEKKFLPEIRNQGLKDFRKRKYSILSEFGATDLYPHSDFLREPVRDRLSLKIVRNLIKLASKNTHLEKLFYRLSESYLGVNLEEINLLCYEFAKCYGELNGAKSIENFDGSLSGNPENYFYESGHLYTISLLDYYIIYAYCCKFLNFDSIESLLEIGTGSGKQIEVIKKLHPKITFYVLDIPPQLYVSEQYLSKIFPDSVISYKKTRKITKIPNEREGKIFILGNWKISQIENLKYDLFWNAVSFQEMEPDVVLNYLQFVNRQTRKYVFLYENLKGKEVASVKGNHGVLNQTNLDHYKNGLKDFEIKNSSKVIRPPRLSSGPNSRFMFWEKK